MALLPVMEKLRHFLTANGGAKNSWILWAGVLGAGVLLLLGFLEGDTKEPAEPQEVSAAQYTAQAYESILEERLTTLLSQVEGAGTVAVMVTLESTEQAVYAQAKQQSSDTAQVQPDGLTERSSLTTDYVLIESNGDEQALMETLVQPTVKGVAVVCTGAGDVAVVSRITQLVATVLGIPSNRICVTK